MTAAKSGLRTGIYFWPGSEVPIQGTQNDSSSEPSVTM